MNKSAQTTAILTFIIAGIVMVLFFAGWIYMFNQMTTVMQGITTSTNQVNITDAVSKTIAPVNNAMNGLHTISIAILLGLILGMFIEAYYVRKHPILFVVHFLIVSLAVTASIYISNQYEILTQNPLLGTNISAFTGVGFIMQYLPLITTVIGFIGLILMFIAISRDPEYSRGGL